MIFHIDFICNCSSCKTEKSVHFEFNIKGSLLDHGSKKIGYAKLPDEEPKKKRFEGYCGKCGIIHLLKFDYYNMLYNVVLTDRIMK